MNDFTIHLRDMHPHAPSGRRRLTEFLAGHGLRYESDIEYAVGAFDEEDTLIGCGCCAGDVLKCFAVAESARGHNLMGAILSHLVTFQFQRGVSRLLVFTKPESRLFFEQSGFHVVGETGKVVLLENVPDGVSRFVSENLDPRDAAVASGSIVMNCNPFTLGHRHLIEHAAARSPLVHIFLVEEDRSVFPFAVRKRLVLEGTADLPNVRIHGSGRYVLSAATFPSYFLKRDDDVTDVYTELDVTIFARRIAPGFSIRRRYVGQEPFCPVTRKYNEAMRRLLPLHGIEFQEIPRLEAAGLAVSASRVREILKEKGVHSSLKSLVPEPTYRFLTGDEAGPVLERIKST